MGDSAVYVGCCGFRESRARYFEHFPTVELQAPFYEMPSAALATKWREQAPPDFRFCVKAWQLITHTPASPTYRRLKSKVSPSEKDLYGSFRNTEQVWLAWERTREIAVVLSASVILFQCPASFHPSAENLSNFRTFFRQADRGASLLAWEPRGPWTPEQIKELCAEFDLLHCVDPFKAESVYGETVYWRLHGKGGYSYKYPDEEIDWLTDQTRRAVADRRGPVYVLFNNISMSTDALRFSRSVLEQP